MIAGAVVQAHHPNGRRSTPFVNLYVSGNDPRAQVVYFQSLRHGPPLAQEAARAGATTVDVSSAYASGSFVVDQGRALDAARRYLIAAGYHQFTLSADGTRAIRVSVTITEPTEFLSLVGVDWFTSTGTAVASLVTGVTGGT